MRRVTHRTLNRSKQLVIMDEVDGMSAGDRGGVQELTCDQLEQVTQNCQGWGDFCKGWV